MRPNITIHPTVIEDVSYYQTLDPRLKTRIFRKLKRGLFSALRRSQLSSKLGIVTSRKKIRDESAVILSSHAGSGEFSSKREVFSRAQYPEDTPRGYLFFKQEIPEAEMMGVGLIPVSEEGYLASEALDLSPFDDFSLTTAETRPVKRKECQEFKGRYLSLASHWSYWKGFYHWFLDVLPRLRALEGDHRILVKEPLSSYEKDTLEILGLTTRCDYTSADHVKVERLTFVSPSSFSGSYDPEAIDFIRNLFLNKTRIIPEGKRRVFISREGERRCPRNESEVVSLFKGKGWEIIDCKVLSLREQIQLFSEASHVAGSHGGALTNLLWSPKDCKVFELFPSNRLVPTNENIALHLGMDYNALVFPSKSRSPLEIDLEWLEEVLDIEAGEMRK